MAISNVGRERYPQLVDEMVGLMTRMAETDKEVERVNSAAPYGDHPRLLDLSAFRAGGQLDAAVAEVEVLGSRTFSDCDVR